VIAADLEADFDAARAAGRTTDHALARNPDPQEIGCVAFSAMAIEVLDAGPITAISVPGHRCARCDVAWSGPDPCWNCGDQVPLVIGSRALWVARQGAPAA
jgi:hypothetical protein